jgi:small subunit ribosomal protein S2
VAIVSMKELLEAGVHFGHRSRRWHPKMRSYIFTERNGIHIIDLQQTIRMLDDAYKFVRDTAAEGGTVLFVGTKRQAQENLQMQAERCGMPFVTQRWLGGTLTNFRTIRQRCNYLLELEQQKEIGEFGRLLKKEALWKERELAKLQRRFGGIKNMYYLPSALFVVDVRREEIAVKEANVLGIPVVAMVDTNCDPDPIDYIIPANDDAIRAIKLMVTKLADAVIEGQQMRGVIMAEEEELAQAAMAEKRPAAGAAVALMAEGALDSEAETPETEATEEEAVAEQAAAGEQAPDADEAAAPDEEVAGPPTEAPPTEGETEGEAAIAVEPSATEDQETQD